MFKFQMCNGKATLFSKAFSTTPNFTRSENPLIDMNRFPENYQPPEVKFKVEERAKFCNKLSDISRAFELSDQEKQEWEVYWDFNGRQSLQWVPLRQLLGTWSDRFPRLVEQNAVPNYVPEISNRTAHVRAIRARKRNQQN
eukprot:Pompholyxophrys_punicea_v1_NODE_389_length_2073_cov_14.173439.p2 type:complete len:141 gc:universal NODE_389_length_2073_cov_14.173439:1498-1920(+)